MSGVLVVSVGTDRHPFDRLVRTIVAWASRRGDVVRIVVQHGYSEPSGASEDHMFLNRAELLELYRKADVIVTQVGPGTISDVNAVGRRPIVMPRDPRRGEHVDDHQYAFGRFMDRLGYAWVAESTRQLESLVAAALTDPGRTHLTVAPPDPATAAATFTRVVTEVMNRPRASISIRRTWQMVRRPQPDRPGNSSSAPGR